MILVIAVFADNDGWGHMGSWGGGWMWAPAVVMMALFAVFIVWVVRAIASSTDTSRTVARGPTGRAHDILAERYAKGEITTDEYRERTEELDQSS